MLVSVLRMLMSLSAVFVGRRRVFLSFIVASMFMMMCGLPMMMGSLLVARRGVVVMLG